MPRSFGLLAVGDDMFLVSETLGLAVTVVGRRCVAAWRHGIDERAQADVVEPVVLQEGEQALGLPIRIDVGPGDFLGARDIGAQDERRLEVASASVAVPPLPVPPLAALPPLLVPPLSVAPPPVPLAPPLLVPPLLVPPPLLRRPPVPDPPPVA